MTVMATSLKLKMKWSDLLRGSEVITDSAEWPFAMVASGDEIAQVLGA
jgi:hypothetical protein